MRILVIEDQTMIADLLVSACASTFSPDQIGQAATAASALEQCRKLKPDIILLDLELPDRDGLDLLPELRTIVPSAKVIACSSHTDQVTVHRVLSAHIDGFVDKKSQPMNALGEAIGSVFDGRQYFSPIIQEVRIALRNDPDAFTKLLTDREQELLGLIGAGLTNEEIADRLGLRSRTVQNHRNNIMTKLGLHTTSHLIRYAIDRGFTRQRPVLPGSP